VDAIVSEDDLREDQQHFLALNAELSKDWPVLTEKIDAPPDAADWDTVDNKLQYLER
jgi:ferredoxin